MCFYAWVCWTQRRCWSSQRLLFARRIDAYADKGAYTYIQYHHMLYKPRVQMSHAEEHRTGCMVQLVVGGFGFYLVNFVSIWSVFVGYNVRKLVCKGIIYLTEVKKVRIKLIVYAVKWDTFNEHHHTVHETGVFTKIKKLSLNIWKIYNHVFIFPYSTFGITPYSDV